MRKTGQRLTKDNINNFLLCPEAACFGDKCSRGDKCVFAGKQCCPKDFEINRWGQCVEPSAGVYPTGGSYPTGSTESSTPQPASVPTTSSTESSVAQCNEPNRIITVNNVTKMLSGDQVCSMKEMGLL